MNVLSILCENIIDLQDYSLKNRKLFVGLRLEVKLSKHFTRQIILWNASRNGMKLTVITGA